MRVKEEEFVSQNFELIEGNFPHLPPTIKSPTKSIFFYLNETFQNHLNHNPIEKLNLKNKKNCYIKDFKRISTISRINQKAIFNYAKITWFFSVQKYPEIYEVFDENSHKFCSIFLD
jgi:hypothetical protein